MNALIVEDNQITQLALIQALVKAEYDVHAVMNSEEAVLRIIDVTICYEILLRRLVFTP